MSYLIRVLLCNVADINRLNCLKLLSLTAIRAMRHSRLKTHCIATLPNYTRYLLASKHSITLETNVLNIVNRRTIGTCVTFHDIYSTFVLKIFIQQIFMWPCTLLYLLYNVFVYA